MYPPVGRGGRATGTLPRRHRACCHREQCCYLLMKNIVASHPAPGVDRRDILSLID